MSILITGHKEYIGIFSSIFAFEHIYKNYNFKHLIRTNLSSFFISNKLLELSHNLEEKTIYT